MTIQIKNLNFSYGKNLALKDINLDINSDDFLCIIGPNGGGKSTFLKLILGFLSPSSGQINFEDKNINYLGYVPQNIPINPAFPISALEVVMMGNIKKHSFGFWKKSDKLKAMKALRKVKMCQFANRKISELSGGQRQRIYIARALVSEPEILVLDEPTASIDPKGQAQIYELLQNLNLKGTGIIMVSHDINIAASFAKRIVYINKELVVHKSTSTPIPPSKIIDLSHKKGHFCPVELANLWNNHA